MKRKPLLISSIIIIIALAGVGFLLFKKTKNVETYPPLPAELTYTNEKYGYEIKYPREAELLGNIPIFGGEAVDITWGHIRITLSTQTEEYKGGKLVKVEDCHKGTEEKIINGVTFEVLDVSEDISSPGYRVKAFGYCTFKNGTRYNLTTARTRHADDAEIARMNEMLETFRFTK